MTTSPFDSYRPPEEGGRRRRRERASLRGSSVAPQGPRRAGTARSWLTREGGGRREAPAVPDAATLTRLEGTYGAYWVTTVLHDDAAALTALSQYSPLAEHD